MEKKRSEIAEQYKWDLSDYFKDSNDFYKVCDELLNDLKSVADYKGKIGKDADTLLEFLKFQDELSIKMENIYIYAIHLNYNIDTEDSDGQKMKAKASNVYKEYSEALSFVETELLKSDLKIFIDNPKLNEYKTYLENIEKYREHTLSETEEKLLAKANDAFGSGEDVYDALMYADRDYGKIKDENGKLVSLTSANYQEFILSKNRDLRKRAYKKRNAFNSTHKNTICTSILGTVKESVFTSKIRNYESPLAMSLFDNNLTEKVFQNLINIISNNTKGLKKFYELKRQMLGVSKLHNYDFRVSPVTIDEKITYDEAITKIKGALKIMGSEYSTTASKFIDNKMIDVYPNKGKNIGGFQTGAYKKMPRILLNYVDNVSEVYGLIHEIGHAMHTYYADKNQPFINHAYSLLLAETASLTNEVILTNYLMENAKNADEKIYYLIKQLEEIDTFLFNDVTNVEHEHNIYEAQNSGSSLSTEEMCDNMYDITKKYYSSKNVVISEETKYSWMIHSQYHNPYYFYKYAIAMLVALIIGKNIIDDTPGYKEKYLEFLSSGGSMKAMELYNILGIDLEDENIYINAINYFNELVDSLETLVKNKEVN